MMPIDINIRIMRKPGYTSVNIGVAAILRPHVINPKTVGHFLPIVSNIIPNTKSRAITTISA